jgi:hypothetical protein
MPISAMPAKKTAARNPRKPDKLLLRVLAAKLSLAEERERHARIQNVHCDIALIASLQTEAGETTQ